MYVFDAERRCPCCQSEYVRDNPLKMSARTVRTSAQLERAIFFNGRGVALITAVIYALCIAMTASVIDARHRPQGAR